MASPSELVLLLHSDSALAVFAQGEGGAEASAFHSSTLRDCGAPSIKRRRLRGAVLECWPVWK